MTVNLLYILRFATRKSILDIIRCIKIGIHEAVLQHMLVCDTLPFQLRLSQSQYISESKTTFFDGFLDLDSSDTDIQPPQPTDTVYTNSIWSILIYFMHIMFTISRYILILISIIVLMFFDIKFPNCTVNIYIGPRATMFIAMKNIHISLSQPSPSKYGLYNALQSMNLIILFNIELKMSGIHVFMHAVKFNLLMDSMKIMNFSHILENLQDLLYKICSIHNILSLNNIRNISKVSIQRNKYTTTGIINALTCHINHINISINPIEIPICLYMLIKHITSNISSNKSIQYNYTYIPIMISVQYIHINVVINESNINTPTMELQVHLQHICYKNSQNSKRIESNTVKYFHQEYMITITSITIHTRVFNTPIYHTPNQQQHNNKHLSNSISHNYNATSTIDTKNIKPPGDKGNGTNTLLLTLTNLQGIIRISHDYTLNTISISKKKLSMISIQIDQLYYNEKSIFIPVIAQENVFKQYKENQISQWNDILELSKLFIARKFNCLLTE